MCTYTINRILFFRAAVGVLAALLWSCTVAQTDCGQICRKFVGSGRNFQFFSSAIITIENLDLTYACWLADAVINPRIP